MATSSSSSGGASIPVLDRDIPLVSTNALNLDKFLLRFRNYNESDADPFSEEQFISLLRAANLYKFDHLRVVLNHAHFSALFAAGDETSYYNFGNPMFRAVMMTWVREIVDAEAGAANAATTSVGSASSSTAATGSNTGSQAVAVSASSVGKSSLNQALDLDDIVRSSSEKPSLASRIRQLQAGLRMMDPPRINFLSNFSRLELDLKRYRATWSSNYFLAMGSSADSILKIFPEAGLYAKVRELPVFKDDKKLMRLLTFAFDETDVFELSLMDFTLDDPWVFDFSGGKGAVRAVTSLFKVYIGRCLEGLVDSLVFVSGVAYSPLKALCSEPYSGYGVVANYPDVYLFVLYHQLLVSLSRLLNDVPGSTEVPLHGPGFVVPIFLQKFSDINKFVDSDKLPLPVFEANVLPYYVFADPNGKRPRVSEEAGKLSRSEKKKLKSSAASNPPVSAGGFTSASSTQRTAVAVEKASVKSTESGYCVFNLASLTDVMNNGQKPVCRKEQDGKVCSRTHASTHEAVTTNDAVAAFDAMLRRSPGMSFLSEAKAWFQNRK